MGNHSGVGRSHAKVYDTGSEKVAYLDIEGIVNLDSLAKGMDVLHHTGELPSTSYLFDERRIFGGRRR
jgi:hypothetical protein